MRITSHAACGPIVDIKPDGTVLISRMEYVMDGHSTIRHIMETGKPEQTVLATLIEGIQDEGIKDKETCHIEVLTKEPIYFEFVADNKKIGGSQMKVVFPVSVPGCALRDRAKSDGDNPYEVHGPITMVEIAVLITETDRRTVPFHYRTTRAVLSWAAKRNRQVFEKYENLVLGWSVPPLTAMEKVAVQEYVGSW